MDVPRTDVKGIGGKMENDRRVLHNLRVIDDSEGGEVNETTMTQNKNFWVIVLKLTWSLKIDLACFTRELNGRTRHFQIQ